MKTKALFFLLLLTPTAHAIIGGESCAEHEFPASLELVKFFGHSYAPICGATLIAPDVAVTAAHCVEGLTHDFEYFVTSAANAQNLNLNEFAENSPTTIRVRTVVSHGNYHKIIGPGPYHDIALLFLNRRSWLPPARIITPLEAQILRPGLIAHIVGWGQQTTGASGTVQTPIVKTWAQTFINHLTPWEMQLGSIIHSAHKCFGDSGGATYIELPSETIGAPATIRMTGITSHGSGNDLDCRKGGFDTRIDTYYGWIEDIMLDACLKGYRLFCDSIIKQSDDTTATARACEFSPQGSSL